MTVADLLKTPKNKMFLRARWVCPVDAEPIENGMIEIEQGQIIALHTNHHDSEIDLGNVAIIPGLVNCHTHLELSDLSQPLRPTTSFADWIRSLIAHRSNRTTKPQQILKQGMLEAITTGSTMVGDIVDVHWKADFFDKPHAQVVAFLEVIGLLPEQQSVQLDFARKHLDSLQHANNYDILPGLSPHAPYSVHRDLLSKIIQLANQHSVPVAMHLAETTEEIELLQNGSGVLVELLKRFGIWRDDLFELGMRPLDYLKLLATAQRGLVVHGNYLAEEELDFLATNFHLTTIYCPRTFHYFHHQTHPWLRLMNKGANVALGTDSCASNPDLSLWQELLFLHRQFPHLSVNLLLELGTIAGARAFDLDHLTGSLHPGKQADLAVVSLPETNQSSLEQLLMSPNNQIVATMKKGEWLHRNNPSQPSTD